MDLTKLNVSFSGGGAKGITYLGFLKYIEENNIKLNSISGTSIGAIVATAHACGLKHTEIKRIFERLNLDILNLLEEGNIFQKIYAFFYSRTILSKKVKKTLKQYFNWGKVNIPLSICGTNVSYSKADYFTCSDGFKPALYKAVYASMCIPMIFKRIKIHKSVYCDGGVLDNNCTVNLKVENYNILVHNNTPNFLHKETFKYTKIRNIFEYLLGILTTMIGVGNRHGIELYDNELYIKPITESIVGFKSSDIDKAIDIGYKATKKFFENN